MNTEQMVKELIKNGLRRLVQHLKNPPQQESELSFEEFEARVAEEQRLRRIQIFDESEPQRQ